MATRRDELRRLVKDKSYRAAGSSQRQASVTNANNTSSVFASSSMLLASQGSQKSQAAGGGSPLASLSAATGAAGGADPLKMLGLAPGDARGLTELHMARKGLRAVHPHIRLFTNLEILFLNDNALTEVTGLLVSHDGEGTASSTAPSASTTLPTGLSSSLLLAQQSAPALLREKQQQQQQRSGRRGDNNDGVDDVLSVQLPPPPKADRNIALSDPNRGCARLKRLYLSNNRISTVAGDLQDLRYLEILLLANNLLSDVHAVSRLLRPLRFLRQLDLFGNPLCEERHYRLYIIAHHPSVEVLDRHTVTIEERREAAALFGNRALSSKALAGGGAGTATGAAGSKARTMQSLAADDSQSSAASALMDEQDGTANPRDRKTRVGFGTSVPPAIPMRRADALSPSVVLLEGRCAMIKAEEAAAKRRVKDKAVAETSELCEQRRLFHELWGQAANSLPNDEPETPPPAPPTETPAANVKGKKPAAGQTARGNKQQQQLASQQQQLAQQQERERRRQKEAEGQRRRLAEQQALAASIAIPERLVSRIYNLEARDALDAKIVELIELQRRLEEAENINDDEQADAIAAEIHRKQHALAPERQGDQFGAALLTDKAEKCAADAARYDRHVVSEVVFLPEEVALVGAQFADQGSVFTLDRLQALLTAATSRTAPDKERPSRALQPAFIGRLREAFVTTFPPPPALDKLNLPRIRQRSVAGAHAMSSVGAGATAAFSYTRGADAAMEGTVSSAQGTPRQMVAHSPRDAQHHAPRQSMSYSRESLGPRNTEMLRIGAGGLADAALDMKPIPIHDALAALSRYVPFLEVRLEELEALALQRMRSHNYDALKPIQHRINDIRAHMDALRKAALGGPIGGSAEGKPHFVAIADPAAQLANVAAGQYERNAAALVAVQAAAAARAKAMAEIATGTPPMAPGTAKQRSKQRA